MRRLGSGIRLRQQKKHLSVSSVGDPHLRTGDVIGIPLAPRDGRDRLQIRSRVRFRETNASSRLAFREARQKPLLLIVRAEAEQTLAEYLSWNVRVMVPPRLHPTAEYLIGNINDSGRLDVTFGQDQARVTYDLGNLAAG